METFHLHSHYEGNQPLGVVYLIRS